MKRKMARGSTLYQMSFLYGCIENIYMYVYIQKTENNLTDQIISTLNLSVNIDKVSEQKLKLSELKNSINHENGFLWWKTFGTFLEYSKMQGKPCRTNWKSSYISWELHDVILRSLIDRFLYLPLSTFKECGSKIPKAQRSNSFLTKLTLKWKWQRYATNFFS